MYPGAQVTFVHSHSTPSLYVPLKNYSGTPYQGKEGTKINPSTPSPLLLGTA